MKQKHPCLSGFTALSLQGKFYQNLDSEGVAAAALYFKKEKATRVVQEGIVGLQGLKMMRIPDFFCSFFLIYHGSNVNCKPKYVKCKLKNDY